MPRTWSYRKRDYELVKPVGGKMPAGLIVLICLYCLIVLAMITGIGFTMTHPINDASQKAVVAPVLHQPGTQEMKDD